MRRVWWVDLSTVIQVGSLDFFLLFDKLIFRQGAFSRHRVMRYKWWDG